MKNLIKKILGKYYIIIFENRLKKWSNEYRIEQLKNQLKSVGQHFNLEYPNKIFNLKYISIGNNFSCWHNARIEAIDNYESEQFTPHIKIGNDVSIGPYFHLGCINNVYIGNNVLIASNVYITDHAHGQADYTDINTAPEKRELTSKGPVYIDDNVWIGNNVCILPNVKIGKNTIIGANSVVTKDVPPYCIVAGVPAKIINTTINTER